MKKFLSCAAIALAMSMSMISCSNDDDNNSSNQQTSSSLRIDFHTGLNAGSTIYGEGPGGALGSKMTLGDHTQYLVGNVFANVSINSSLSSLSGTINGFDQNILAFTTGGMQYFYEAIDNQVEYTITNYQEVEVVDDNVTLIKGKLTFSGYFRCVNPLNPDEVYEEAVQVSGSYDF